MPFITEELYQKMDNNKGFLLQSPFPTFNNRLVFIEAFNRIELLKGIVSETRKTRTENRIDPGKSIPVLLKTSSEKEKQIIPEYLKYFNRLTKSSRTEIVDDFSPVLKGFRAVTGRWEILLPFEKEADRQKELGRLKGEYEELVKRIEDFESKLAEPSFLGKAPDKVIQDIKLRLQESIEKKYRLQKTIGDLS
jgi:valyl-tRNA synthetase